MARRAADVAGGVAERQRAVAFFGGFADDTVCGSAEGRTRGRRHFPRSRRGQLRSAETRASPRPDLERASGARARPRRRKPRTAETARRGSGKRRVAALAAAVAAADAVVAALRDVRDIADFQTRAPRWSRRRAPRTPNPRFWRSDALEGRAPRWTELRRGRRRSTKTASRTPPPPPALKSTPRVSETPPDLSMDVLAACEREVDALLERFLRARWGALATAAARLRRWRRSPRSVRAQRAAVPPRVRSARRRRRAHLPRARAVEPLRGGVLAKRGLEPGSNRRRRRLRRGAQRPGPRRNKKKRRVRVRDVAPARRAPHRAEHGRQVHAASRRLRGGRARAGGRARTLRVAHAVAGGRGVHAPGRREPLDAGESTFLVECAEGGEHLARRLARLVRGPGRARAGRPRSTGTPSRTPRCRACRENQVPPAVRRTTRALARLSDAGMALRHMAAAGRGASGRPLHRVSVRAAPGRVPEELRDERRRAGGRPGERAGSRDAGGGGHGEETRRRVRHRIGDGGSATTRGRFGARSPRAIPRRSARRGRACGSRRVLYSVFSMYVSRKSYVRAASV